VTKSPSEKSVAYAADGRRIVTFFDEYREPVRLDQVSPIMKQAIVGIEDWRFYEHGALDVKSTIRALAHNSQSGEAVQGGSTLTQQYAKNLLLNNAKTKAQQREVTAATVVRKLRELRHALKLEETMTKDQILEGYLNIAYFGAGAYGIQAAAKRFFSKPAADLDLPEAAMLAGLTKNPVAFDPIRHPREAKLRRNTVLDRLAEIEIISPAAALAAGKKKIKLRPSRPKGGCATSKVPFFCGYVRNEMIRILSHGQKERIPEAIAKLQRGGFTIRTTLDWVSQAAAQRAVNASTTPRSPRVAAEALVEPGTGQIKALVSSKRYGTKKGRTTINLAADVAHGGGVGVSAGSTFKIFTLLAALDKGMGVGTNFHAPGRMRIGGFRTCKGRRLPMWNVGNSSESEAGVFNMRSGTAHSVNTYFAWLQRVVGLCSSVKMAEKFGMRRSDGRPLQQVAPQVLGSNEIDMVHLSAAFAGIAAHGRYCPPVAIVEVTNPNGRRLKLPGKGCRQVVSPRIARTVMSIMRSVMDSGTAKRVPSPGKGAAGKTGTCENFSCAVFAGSVRGLTAAVAYWDFRGGFRHPVSGVYGANTPATIWSRSLKVATGKRPELVSLPRVDGMSLGAAMSTLASAGFRTNVSQSPVGSVKPKGSVAFTSPDARIEKGGTVTIFVSNG
jgi:membrane peptidoglycan carboxypeptidase